MGFEPMRAEHIGLAVQRLNHSATSSCDTLTRYMSSLHNETDRARARAHLKSSGLITRLECTSD